MAIEECSPGQNLERHAKPGQVKRLTDMIPVTLIQIQIVVYMVIIVEILLEAAVN